MDIERFAPNSYTTVTCQISKQPATSEMTGFSGCRYYLELQISLGRYLIAEETGMEMLVHINPEGVKKNINPFDHGSALHTDVMKTLGLIQALDAHGFDAAFGGARRD